MKLDRKLALKVLTDPAFRKMMEENPQEALDMAGIKGGLILNYSALVEYAQRVIADSGEQILCNGTPGSCGIC